MDRPGTCPQTVACRVYFVNITAAFDCQNRYISIILGIAELFDEAGSKKAFGIFVWLEGSAPITIDIAAEIRNKTSARKINFFRMQKQ